MSSVVHFLEGSVTCRDIVNGAHCLTCTCTRYRIKGFCKHIQKVMKDRSDADHITRDLPVKIGVHIFSDLEIDVALDPHVQGHPRILVETTKSLDPYVSQDHDIGLLAPGEGRIDIRSMFIEWIIGQIVIDTYDDGRPCISAHHVDDEQFSVEELIENLHNHKDSIIDYWSLRQHFQCARCLELSLSTEELRAT